jgi:hypothetical protein
MPLTKINGGPKYYSKLWSLMGDKHISTKILNSKD